MRTKLVVLLGICALALGACTKTNDTATDTSASPSIGPDEFSLTGMLVDAKAGVTPPTASPSPTPTQTPAASTSAQVGGLAVRPTSDADAVNVDGCARNQGTLAAYYDENTQFDPSDVTDDASFPENIQGRNVTVTGSIDKNGSACVLTAERVAVVENSTPSSSSGGNGNGNGSGGTGSSGSPSASSSPVVTGGGTGGFPSGNNGTDPIFEGTPSPDPCEGQKACEQHRETGQEPQP